MLARLQAQARVPLSCAFLVVSAIAKSTNQQLDVQYSKILWVHVRFEQASTQEREGTMTGDHYNGLYQIIHTCSAVAWGSSAAVLASLPSVSCV